MDRIIIHYIYCCVYLVFILLSGARIIFAISVMASVRALVLKTEIILPKKSTQSNSGNIPESTQGPSGQRK
ncbi:hypothetical protein LOD99_7752 [Oopsacas minuta]|uniref:Uncharacterized protein n=1 Tax=Oopsacas minuta TaxID=111878 RepID=A0AAV7JPU1_9METZ|nr:hypothetical protein LOD99_7752 [Oopsacas minuta]